MSYLDHKNGLSSKPSYNALEIVLKIYTRCLTVESPGTKPGCKDFITLIEHKKLKTCLCTIFSITFLSVLTNETCL